MPMGACRSRLLLRVDNNAQLMRLPWTLRRMFAGRYAVVRGKKTFDARWTKQRAEGILQLQRREPVPMVRDGRRLLWRFMDRFYWDDEGLEAEDVKALVLQRYRRLEQRLQSARSLMHAERNGRRTRSPIPVELRRAVFERDGGRCVECGSDFDLQYDHLLPVTLGGATTLENLQLLCANCNQHKSDSL
jgi:hypothetical protein